MIYRIVDADGSIVMSLDYPDTTIPKRYLKEGQTLYGAPEGARLHLQDDKLKVIDGVVVQAFMGPVQEPFNGDGEQLTIPAEPEEPLDPYLAVPAGSEDQT